MQFQHSYYTVETTQQPSCVLSLRITVNSDGVKKMHERATKNINKKVSIPGFRKGKAPADKIQKDYPSIIEKEWKDVLLNDALHEAIQLTKIAPLNERSVRNVKLEKASLEEGAIISLDYEHFPQVPDLDFSKVSAPKVEKKSLSKDDVNKTLEEIRSSHANWEPITDRSAQEGDFIEITLESIEEGGVSRLLLKDRRFCIDVSLPEWLRNLVLGMNPGEKREGEAQLTAQTDKPIKVLATLTSLLKCVLPPVDDALAQKVGAANVEDLMQKIKHNLEKSNEEDYREKCYKEIENALLQQFPFDLPKTLIEMEQKHRMERALNHIDQERISPEEKEVRKQTLQEDSRKASEESLRLYFLERKIMDQANLKLSKRELDEAIEKEIHSDPFYYYYQKQQKVPLNQLTSNLVSSIQKKRLREYLLHQVLSA